MRGSLRISRYLTVDMLPFKKTAKLQPMVRTFQKLRQHYIYIY